MKLFSIKSKNKTSSRESFHGSFSPKRDWREMVILFYIVSAIVFLISLYFFIQIYRDDAFIFDHKEQTSISNIDKTKLIKVLDNIEKKEIVLKRIMEKEIEREVDPSLSY